MRIYLTGFMGAGKTTVGKKLAQQLNYDFADLDQQIEKATGKSITELFNEGENIFRETESLVLKQQTAKNNCVISTGGGTACFNDNITWMNNDGFTIYLKLSAGSLFHRLIESKTKRPLLAGKSDVSLMEYIMLTLGERDYYYSQSKMIFKGENADISELVKSLKKEEPQLR